MKHYCIAAKEVIIGDIMNYTHHPRNYDRVKSVSVPDKNGNITINFFTAAYLSCTVKHAEQAISVWR